MLTCAELLLRGPLFNAEKDLVQTKWDQKRSRVAMYKEDKANLIEADGDLWTEYNTNGLTVNQAIGNMRLLNHKRFKKDLECEIRFLRVMDRYHVIANQAIRNVRLLGHKHSKKDIQCEIRVLRDMDRDHGDDMVISCPQHDFDVKVRPLKRKGDHRLLTGAFNEWYCHALEQRQEQERQAALRLAENTAMNTTVHDELCIFAYAEQAGPDLARRTKRRIEQEEQDRQKELVLENLEKIRHDAEKEAERMLKETQERETEEQEQRAADAAAAEALARERTQRLYTTEVLALMCDGPRERTQRLSMNYGAASGTANATIDRVAMVDSENTTRDTLGKNPHFAPFGGYANNRDGRWSPDV